jgi:hypothetical protein
MRLPHPGHLAASACVVLAACFPDYAVTVDAGAGGDASVDAGAEGGAGADSSADSSADAHVGATGDAGDAGDAGTSSSTPAAPTQIASADASVTAPSGTPGQRHLIHAGSSWWVFFLLGPTELSAVSAGDATPTQWSATPSAVLPSYDFGASVDGRTFGLDVEPGGSGDIVHISLSSTVPVPKLHARALVTTSPDTIAPATTASMNPTQPSQSYSTVNVDGTVTGVPTGLTGGFDVIDFGTVAQVSDGGSPTEPATAFLLADDGMQTWGPAAPNPPFPLVPGGEHISSRAVLGLGNGNDFVLVWNDLGPSQGPGLFTRGFYSASGWTPSSAPLDPTDPSPSDRTWAACAEGGNAHVVWSGGGRFFQQELPAQIVDGGASTWTSMAAPSAPDPVSDVFLACRAGAIVVFAIVASGGTHAPGTILMSSWTGGIDWTAWSVAVDPPASGQTRCYLSGFDRIVVNPNTSVGLVWTEAAQGCATAAATSLWTAIVQVP